MIDLESMIESLQLAWLKRIFQCNNGAWRSFLRFSLEPFGGLVLFHCNYDIKEIHTCISQLNSIPSHFNGGVSFVLFSIVERKVNIFCGITKRYVQIRSLFSIKYFLNKVSFSQMIFCLNQMPQIVLLLFQIKLARLTTLNLCRALSFCSNTFKEKRLSSLRNKLNTDKYR